MDEASRMNLTEEQRHALYAKVYASNLESLGLRSPKYSPKYYEDKSLCLSFQADVDPVIEGHFKAWMLRSGYIEPKDLIERLRQLKSSGNFELREYHHPYMSRTKSPLCKKENPSDARNKTPNWVDGEVMRAL